MTSENAQNRAEQRVLLVPSTSRDASAITSVLKSVNVDCEVCSSLSALCQSLTAGAGTVLIAEEFLKVDFEQLVECVAAQPVWSDLPIIVLSQSGAELPSFSLVLAQLGNVSVLERPVRISTLLSVVQTSIRARMRQYQSRDYYLERERLLASERQARSDSERAGRIKDEFLATLSHELRTPLNAILGWSQILSMKGVGTTDVTEGIKVIERNARAQTKIIEDLLEMSRIISGKVRLDIQEVDLAEIVRQAVDTVRPAADAKDIHIQTILDATAGKVSGDPNRLQQVLWNLLSNAVKFTPKEGLVQILLERTSSHLNLSVIDNGQGMDEAFLPYVFDRFRQADSTITRQHGGLGLGLAIVKQLVDLHGGSIRAASSGIGLGSSFVITLPVRAVQHSVLQPQDPLDSSSSDRPVTEPIEVSLAGLKILVLDDEPDARELLKRLLETRQATVCVCESTAQAIEALRSERPHAIVSDIGMPQEDGYSFMRRVRKLPSDLGGTTPALALTAYARAEDRVQAIRAGFQNHLTKPVEPAELVAVLVSLTAHR